MRLKSLRGAQTNEQPGEESDALSCSASTHKIQLTNPRKQPRRHNGKSRKAATAARRQGPAAEADSAALSGRTATRASARSTEKQTAHRIHSARKDTRSRAPHTNADTHTNGNTHAGRQRAWERVGERARGATAKPIENRSKAIDSPCVFASVLSPRGGAMTKGGVGKRRRVNKKRQVGTRRTIRRNAT